MKIRVSRAYLCFALGALLVGALTLVEVPCPIDGGTGIIIGAKDLKVTGTEAELVDYEQNETGCGLAWYNFTYTVNISVVNEAIAPSQGGLVIRFYAPENPGASGPTYQGEGGEEAQELREELLLGPPISSVPIFARVPAKATETIEKTVEFRGSDIYEESHNISVKIAEEIPCPYSGGTGKVPITEWLKLKAEVQ